MTQGLAINLAKTFLKLCYNLTLSEERGSRFQRSKKTPIPPLRLQPRLSGGRASFSRTDSSPSLPLLSRQPCPSSKGPTRARGLRRAGRSRGRHCTHRPARSLSARAPGTVLPLPLPPAGVRASGQVCWTGKDVRGDALGQGEHRSAPAPQTPNTERSLSLSSPSPFASVSPGS